MVEQVKKNYDRQAYERAIYRIHDVDDPELKKHFQNIIDSYEKAHPRQERVAELLMTKKQQMRA